MDNDEKDIERLIEVAFMEYGISKDDRQQIKEDLMFVRRLRKGSEDTRVVVRRTAITVFITGMATIIWWGIREAFNRIP